jgi:hypothetical protein
MEIRLGGRNFTIATDRQGNPLVATSSRPSQPVDGGAIQFIEWRTDGHDLNSFEYIGPGAATGYLGRDYGVNTDGRWLGVDTLGPLINTVTLSGFDSPIGAALLGGDAVPGPLLGGGAVASSAGMGPSQVVSASDTADTITALSTAYAYVGRGASTAKIDLSDFSFDELKTFSSVVTDVQATTPASTSVRQELSVALGESVTYQVLQQPNVGTPDTWLLNSAGEDADVFGVAPDRTIAMAGNIVKGNIQTGAVTMASPNWQTVSTLTTQDIQGTGFALDGNLWVLGTTDGPYMLDSNTGDFFPLMPELDINDNNCRNMESIFGVGVVIPLELSLRWQRYGAGASFGVETFQTNTSPVQGTATGLAGSPREFYTSITNPTTDDTYLVVWKPQEESHDRGGVYSPFVISRFTDTESRFLRWIGSVNGLRTNPTLMGGYGSDIFWITTGRTARWIDDANYLYGPTGSTFLTEMRRFRNILVDVEYVEGELSGTMDADKTVALYLSMDSGAYTQIGTTQTSTGFKRFLASSSGIPLSAFHGIHRVKPRIDYATNSSSAAPQWNGPLRLAVRTRPTEVTVWQYTVDIVNDPSVDDPYGYEAFLNGLATSAPQAFESHDRVETYVRVKDVQFQNIDARGNSDIDSRGLARQAVLVLEEWSL